MVIIDTRLDTSGRKPDWHKGQKVWFSSLEQEASVVEQILLYDYASSYWGDVILEYNDGTIGAAHSWQLSRIVQ